MVFPDADNELGSHVARRAFAALYAKAKPLGAERLQPVPGLIGRYAGAPGHHLCLFGNEGEPLRQFRLFRGEKLFQNAELHPAFGGGKSSGQIVQVFRQFGVDVTGHGLGILSVLCGRG